MGQVAKKEETAVSNIATPAHLLQVAVEQGADLDKLEKLMDLQDRYNAEQARRSFLEAFTHFQSIVPAIKKRKQGHNCMYAPLGDIAEQIKTPLFECGLSYRFEQAQSSSGAIQITCIVSHVDGHSQSNAMTSFADESGKKNPIQSIASTVSYLQRYTLIGALGISTADEDIDGRLIDGDFISDEQLAELEGYVSTMANRDKFLAHFNIKELRDLPASKYVSAMALLKKKAQASQK